MSRYVPPHKRNTTDNFQHFKPRTKRRNFQPGSGFNRLTEHHVSINSSGKEPGLIEIPEIITPPIVESVSENRYNGPCDEGCEDTVTIPGTGTSDQEIRFFREMAELRIEHVRKQSYDEFMEWNDHYRDELKAMYDECVNPDLGMSRRQFVQLAYKCTQAEFDRKKLKQTRPLL